VSEEGTGPVVAKPANYDSTEQKIVANPDDLYQLATVTLVNQSTGVNDTLGKIATTWHNLKLGWYGGTADEADDFTTKWLALIVRFFGPEDPNAQVLPGQAILPKIAAAGGTAAGNLGNAEDAVIKMFNAFTTPDDASGGSGRDEKTGPIWETNTVKVPGA
jgi:hypothetical protein